MGNPEQPPRQLQCPCGECGLGKGLGLWPLSPSLSCSSSASPRCCADCFQLPAWLPWGGIGSPSPSLPSPCLRKAALLTFLHGGASLGLPGALEVPTCSGGRWIQGGALCCLPRIVEILFAEQELEACLSLAPGSACGLLEIPLLHPFLCPPVGFGAGWAKGTALCQLLMGASQDHDWNPVYFVKIITGGVGFMGLKRQRKVCRVGYKVKVVPGGSAGAGNEPPRPRRSEFEGQGLGNGPPKAVDVD